MSEELQVGDLVRVVSGMRGRTSRVWTITRRRLAYVHKAALVADGYEVTDNPTRKGLPGVESIVYTLGPAVGRHPQGAKLRRQRGLGDLPAWALTKVEG